MLMTVLKEYEYGEMRLQALLFSKSLEDIELATTRFWTSLDEHGYLKPELMSVDNPAGESDFWIQWIPSLRADVQPPPPNNHSNLPTATLPANLPRQYLRNEEDINEAFVHVLSNSNISTIGFDCEWSSEGPSPASRTGATQMSDDPKSCTKIVVSQLATAHGALLCQVKRPLPFLAATRDHRLMSSLFFAVSDFAQG